MAQEPEKSKAIDTHPRRRDNPLHDEWRQRIGEGVRKAKIRSRKAGYMTIAELTFRSGFSRRAIREFLDSEQLKSLTIGRRTYVKVGEWKRFVAANCAA